ncbi:CHAD domain-containing protein [Imhoffiella purpurea]|uniref:Adenylate cyclase n=1 Tax=Imhoffiella purpurea TaxID=1249627 RepID=W9VA50_9GAMM|nr:CHAD domain-containing protein [Imhoffiella purpurea]EXJ13791.1 Adenylate cyclase [Imhoffiella purpurea]
MNDSNGVQPGRERDERAAAAAKRILGDLFDTLIANVDGARDNRDPECLHDLRVATRRTRSALGQIKGVFSEEIAADFKYRFAWLQQVTGPTRDLDVYLHAFDDYAASLPPALRPHLEPLRRYLASRYDSERAALVAALASDGFRGLVEDWSTFLAEPVPDDPDEPNAGREIGAVADERLWRLTKRVRREARGIRASSPPEQLHELRKSCKKLRYLIEFFTPLYPQADARRLIKSLKRLLDHLGAYQDLSVQVHFLTDTARRMRDAGWASTETLLAMGALIGHLLSRQQETRESCESALEFYLEEDHQAFFRALFATGR